MATRFFVKDPSNYTDKSRRDRTRTYESSKRGFAGLYTRKTKTTYGITEIRGKPKGGGSRRLLSRTNSVLAQQSSTDFHWSGFFNIISLAVLILFAYNFFTVLAGRGSPDTFFGFERLLDFLSHVPSIPIDWLTVIPKVDIPFLREVLNLISAVAFFLTGVINVLAFVFYFLVFLLTGVII